MNKGLGSRNWEIPGQAWNDSGGRDASKSKSMKQKATTAPCEKDPLRECFALARVPSRALP